MEKSTTGKKYKYPKIPQVLYWFRREHKLHGIHRTTLHHYIYPRECWVILSRSLTARLGWSGVEDEDIQSPCIHIRDMQISERQSLLNKIKRLVLSDLVNRRYAP